MHKRQFLAFSLSSIASLALAQTQDYEERFLRVWNLLDKEYCFFQENGIDWAKVREIYLPLTQNCKSESAFLDMMDSVLRETCDGHTYIRNPNAGMPRSPLFDLYVEGNDGRCFIQAVHEYSSAKVAGLTMGMEILQIDGASIEATLKELMPKAMTHIPPKIGNYLLNMAVSGRWGKVRKLLIKDANGEKEISLWGYRGPKVPDFEAKLLDNNIGYMALHTFGDDEIVEQFDAALEQFKGTRGLVVDVRYNGGGDTAIARPIMGRFIEERKIYATMAKRRGRGMSGKWIEYVRPRGRFTYTAPVVILCNHWSASMAEGFPMGMRALCGAKIVGTKMMGLGAAVYGSTKAGLDFQYSAEPVYDIFGISRDDVVPDIVLNDADDYIANAISVLENWKTGIRSN